MKRLHPSAARRRLRDEEGLSLLEVMVAMFVLAVSILALASVASASLISLRATRDREQATNAASAVIEDVRARDFRSIGLAAGAPDTTCFDSEPVVEVTNDPVPFTQTAGVNDNLTVTTYITWFQEDGGNSTCTDTNDRLSKRVTVIAAWSDRGGAPRQVRQSTVVARVGRGLPVPDFRLAPGEDQTVPVVFDPDHTGFENERCVFHTLRNLGAEDGYDWELARAVGASGNEITPTLEAGTTFKVGTRWKSRAFFEFNEDPDEERLTQPALSPEGMLAGDVQNDPDMRDYFELMTDTDLNGRPETTKRVPPGETARVWFCHEADNVSAGNRVDFTLRVHSRFDENRVERARHQLRVEEQARNFFLFFDADLDATQDQDRSAGAIYTMGDITGLPPAFLLGTEQALPDWDRNVDEARETVSVPGIRVIPGTADWDLVWHHRFPVATTLKPDAADPEATKLFFWSGTTAALTDPVSMPAVAEQLRFTITLQRIHRNEKNIEQTIATVTTALYSHDQPGWMPQVVDFGNIGDVTFTTNQFLRVRIACHTDSTVDCHVAFGHESMASRLRVVERPA